MRRNRIMALAATMAFVAWYTAACSKGQAREAGPRYALVVQRDIAVSANAAGVIEPVATVEVKSQASGEITEITVNEGDQVKRGQLLVRVDPRVPRAAVEQATADSVVAAATLRNAEAQLQRAGSLHDVQALTTADLEAAQLTRASAYAALVRSSTTLQEARIAFEQTEVRAPSDGVILSRTVEAGTVIASASRDVGGGTTLLTMASLDTVQVRALVDETDIGRIHTGMPVTLTVAAFPNQQFSGDVLRIGAQAVAQQNVTMFPVLIRIRNEKSLLKPGMNAEVAVKVQDVRNAVAVPNAALREPGDLASAAALLEIPLDSLESRSDAERPVTVPGRSEGRGGRGRGGDGGRGGGVPRSNRGARDRGDANAAYGGRYDVLVKRDGVIRAVPVRTGVTDYDYSVVVSGLALGDTVVVLPTAGFLDDQAQRQQFIQRRVGNPLGRG